jgi:cytoplasmic iron level regulating protein YaaA (DUF328/UPF0246 family)
MKPLFLIACSEAKLKHAAPAIDLYQGQSFKLALKAAHKADADVLILSAQHGVVQPDQMLEPYDCSLLRRSTSWRAEWAKTTAKQLSKYKDRPTTILAGKFYAGAATGFTNKSTPLAGLGIGQQLAVLSRMSKGDTA